MRPILLALVCILMSLWASANSGLADDGGKFAQEFYHSFKSHSELPRQFVLFGPGADRCVKVEPAGLRITLPAEFGGQRRGTGIQSEFGVHGDFEVTMSFEILQDPDPSESVGPTRFGLALALPLPAQNMATFGRVVPPKKEPRFTTWMILANEVAGKPLERFDPFISNQKKGALRMVRKGTMLAYYLAEDSAEEFQLLKEYVFVKDDLIDIRLSGINGSPKAALDARIFDVRVRAESMPGLVRADTAAGNSDNQRLSVIIAIGLLAALVCGAVILWMRRARRAKVSTGAPRRATTK